ncbi:DUF4199 domain-containing protein [Solirubrum puertoriconensis]|uniref:DUF4199 domain-containing protein n=1 Tax=Solirubrum puertoriconensis TaxID=1751427 RepID=A0A9X0L531_SOLP1|nr:DUF4199 domain-containing protein [Solirubrum puertoriconensis]KUG08268.1 hypothetical protein ASU33_08805 [Solirubrum puertoriconensis]
MENTITPNVSPSAVGVRYGIMLGIVSIIFTAVIMMAGLDQNTAVGLLGAVITIVFIVLAHKAFKQANGGFMSYGQGLAIGIIASAVSGILASVFRYIYITFIDPDAMARGMEAARAKLEERGMSDEQIDQAMSMSSKMTEGPVGIVIAIVGSIIVGLILSLIISAITKRTRPEFE